MTRDFIMTARRRGDGCGIDQVREFAKRTRRRGSVLSSNGGSPARVDIENGRKFGGRNFRIQTSVIAADMAYADNADAELLGHCSAVNCNGRQNANVSTESKSPNSKHQTPEKSQNPEARLSKRWCWVFGSCSLVILWSLVIGIRSASLRTGFGTSASARRGGYPRSRSFVSPLSRAQLAQQKILPLLASTPCPII